jgi:hypothetical protein
VCEGCVLSLVEDKDPLDTHQSLERKELKRWSSHARCEAVTVIVSFSSAALLATAGMLGKEAVKAYGEAWAGQALSGLEFKRHDCIGESRWVEAVPQAETHALVP